MHKSNTLKSHGCKSIIESSLLSYTQRRAKPERSTCFNLISCYRSEFTVVDIIKHAYNALNHRKQGITSVNSKVA